MSQDFAYLSVVTEKPPTIEQVLHAASPRMPRFGQKLPNGAILLDEEEIRRFEHRRDSIVLCVHDSLHTPFVTWHRIVTTDSPNATGGYRIMDTCSLGDYFKTLDDAMTAFADRVTKRRHALGHDPLD